MQLPDALQQGLERELQSCSHSELLKAAEKITANYRAQKSSPTLFSNQAARAAYLAMRMPATFAAIIKVLEECRQRLPDWSPKTMVDIGAGPGTGGWAAAQVFPSLQSLVFVEPSFPMVEVGKRLARESDSPLLRDARWTTQAIPAEMALLSYVVAEMTLFQREECLESVWITADVIIVIEPGTPAGYRRILEIRGWALKREALLIAPCPNRKPCPMQGSDWCHFPARVERTRIHKLLKGATLGYEDEKFSYIVFGKIPFQAYSGRVVGNPQKKSGFVQIPLCTDGKLTQLSVTRKQNTYSMARGVDYGSAW